MSGGRIEMGAAVVIGTRSEYRRPESEASRPSCCAAHAGGRACTGRLCRPNRPMERIVYKLGQICSTSPVFVFPAQGDVGRATTSNRNRAIGVRVVRVVRVVDVVVT